MKKYIIPATKVYNVHPSTLIADSGSTTQTLSSGGSNKNGGPTAAEAHEWRGTSTVMGNEW